MGLSRKVAALAFASVTMSAPRADAVDRSGFVIGFGAGLGQSREGFGDFDIEGKR